MTLELFRQDATLAQCTATVQAVTEAGIVLDRTVFYPLGGGQAGDTGWLERADGSRIAIADTRKEKDAEGAVTGRIVHLPAPDQREALLKLKLDEAVTARIDFHMSEPLDKEALTAGLARLVAAALPVVVGRVTDAELDAHPELVKSMSVQPPRGSGTVRTIRIGAAPADAERIGAPGGELIDLQPCGGTHVANTAEIGAVVVTKIEKKSAMSRRVVLGFAD